MDNTDRRAQINADSSERSTEVGSAAAACAFVFLVMSFVIAWSALDAFDTASEGAFLGAAALWLLGLIAAFIAAASRSRAISIGGAIALVFALFPFWGLPLLSWLS